MAEDASLPTSELRLALGMRGGVSLAVWIGGACAEIDDLRCADRDGATDFWSQLLSRSAYSRVVVDVMAGASAGGLNAVLFATAIRHGFAMSKLLGIWSGVGQIDELRRLEEPWISVLNGDVEFLDRIRDELGVLVKTGQPSLPLDQILDVQLSTTLVEPVTRPVPSPSDEALRETRHSARFHFRYDAATHPIDHFDGTGSSLDRLSVAARATASFPVAFEPAIVRSTRPALVDQREPVGEGRLVDCRGVFSEARGPARSGVAVHSHDFVAADGGMVDNIPLGKAIEAIASARADRRTKRVLVYLHPTGPPRAHGAAVTSPSDGVRRSPLAVARALFATRVASESIDADIAQLESHNRRIKEVAAMRFSARAEVSHSGVEAVAGAAWATYRAERASLDAREITGLLSDPLGVLGEDPFPLPAGDDDDVWRSPLAVWSRSSRENLDVLLAEHLGDALPPVFGEDVLNTGLDPLRRACRHLIEWTRELEDAIHSVDFGDVKGQLYRLEYYLDQLKRGLRIALVVELSARNAPDLDDLREFVSEVLAAAEWSLPDSLSVMGTLMPPSSDLVGGVPLKPAVVQLVAALDQLRTARQAAEVDDLPNASLDFVLGDATVSSPTAIAALEVLCFSEHLLGRPGGAAPIEFRRISAAAGTPLAETFARLRAASPVPPDLPPYAASRFLAPNTKLAGNELMSFSAFFDERWRANDWLWGRLDAVPTLVDLLLPDAPDRWALVEQRQREIIADHFAGRPCPCAELNPSSCRCEDNEPCSSDAKMAAYRVGLETLQKPGSESIRHSADALIANSVRVMKANSPRVAGLPIAGAGYIARFVVRRLLRPRGWG